MSVKEKLAELKKSLPKSEAKVKIVEKVLPSAPINFPKEFIKAFSEDTEALPDFPNTFSALSSGKKKNVMANLEYYLLLSRNLTGESGGSNRKVSYSELINALQNSDKQGYKQSEVAIMMGVSASAVNNYIKTGKLYISDKIISKQNLIAFLHSK